MNRFLGFFSTKKKSSPRLRLDDGDHSIAPATKNNKTRNDSLHSSRPRPRAGCADKTNARRNVALFRHVARPPPANYNGAGSGVAGSPSSSAIFACCMAALPGRSKTVAPNALGKKSPEESRQVDTFFFLIFPQNIYWDFTKICLSRFLRT